MMHAEEADRARESAEWVREGVLTYLGWWSAEMEVKSEWQKGANQEERGTGHRVSSDL